MSRKVDECKPLLKGKKVMMYCTGGIRCERATAWGFYNKHSNDVASTNNSFRASV